jgi:hypothetical protein
MGEMATEYVDVPFGGIDQSTAPELVRAPKSLQLVNVTLREPGAYNKRDGYVGLGVPGGHYDLEAIFTRGNALLSYGNGAFSEYDSSVAAWSTVQTNAVPVSSKRVLFAGKANPYDFAGPQIARHAGTGLLCVAWMSTSASTVMALIHDPNAGTTLRVDSLKIGNADASSGGVRVVTMGAKFVAFWNDTALNAIRYSVWDTASVSSGWTSPATAVAGVDAVYYAFDVYAYPDGSAVFVACNHGANLTLYKGSISGSTITLPTSRASGGVSQSGTSVAYLQNDRMIVATCNAVSGVVYKIFNPTTMAAPTTVVVNAGVVAVKQITTYCVYDSISGADLAIIAYTTAVGGARYDATTYFYYANLTGATSTAASVASEAGMALTHKPFARDPLTWNTGGRQSFVGLARFQDLEDTFYTHLDATDPLFGASLRTPVARYSALTARRLNDTSSTDERTCCPVVKSDDSFYWVGISTQKVTDETSPSDYRDQLTLFSCDFSSDACMQTLQYNGDVLIAGSIPRKISPELDADGINRRGVEGFGMLHSPLAPTIVGSAGGSMTAGAVYHYKFVHEYQDTRGRVVRSRPTADTPQTMGVGDTKATLTFPAYTPPMPGYQLYATAIYRSLATPAELLYYRITTLAAGTLSYADTAADTAIADNEVLYTDSGELPNFSAPPCSALCLWKNRIVALDSETGKVWPSKTIIEGEWPGFHEGLAVSTDVHAKLPKYLTADGENLILWWDDAIGVLYGDPASDTGVPGTLTQPLILESSRGIGLRDVKSLVAIPDGTLFMSDRGIYLLGHDLQLTFLGRPVDNFADADEFTLVGATHVASANEARFAFSDGTVLVFDYIEQQWHTHELARGRYDIASTTYWNGEHCVAALGSSESTDRGVWHQVADEIEDVGLTIPTQWQTAWLSFGGVFAKQRARNLWLFGTFESDVQAQAEVAYDFDDTVAETHLIDGSSVMARIELPIGVDRNEVIPSVTLSGFKRLVAARLEVEIEKGTQRRARTVA